MNELGVMQDKAVKIMTIEIEAYSMFENYSRNNEKNKTVIKLHIMS